VASAAAPFRRLHVLTAPFCPELQSYDTTQLLARLLEHAAVDTHCTHLSNCSTRDLAKPQQGITFSHNHPRFQNSSPPCSSTVRHSPYPSFSLHAYYKQGGGGGSGTLPLLLAAAQRLQQQQQQQQHLDSSGGSNAHSSEQHDR
jgi:hypothetical protein